MKIAVTGASGYIGSSLVRAAQLQGHEILLLTRSRPAAAQAQWQHFDLAERAAIALPADVDVVLHLAFNPAMQTEADGAAELRTAQRLLEAAAAVGARFVFVSSQTARADAPTLYGRVKWDIERLVLQAGGTVLRPGQVYGGEEKGLFGLLTGIVARLPLLPAFLPAPQIQPVHVDDLAEALLRTAADAALAGQILAVAQATPVSFGTFLGAIARDRLQVRRLFVPVPIFLISWLTILLGPARSHRLGLSRLKSLFELPLMASQASLQALDLPLRPLRLGMARAPADAQATRARLRCEAHVLLVYVLRQAPSDALLQRYVDAVTQCRADRVLDLPEFVLRWPLLLALLDDRAFLASARGAELAWRLDAATLLAEATPAGANVFIGMGRPAGFVRYGLRLAGAVAMEIFWRLARIAAMPLFLRAAIDRSFP